MLFLPVVKFLFVIRVMSMVPKAPTDIETKFPTNIGTSLPVLYIKSDTVRGISSKVD